LKPKSFEISVFVCIPLFFQVFQKLPSRADYPDYYEIIKRPMDMEKIRIKLQQSHYESLDDLAGDLMLMLDNACKFNEPDSYIYKVCHYSMCIIFYMYYIYEKSLLKVIVIAWL